MDRILAALTFVLTIAFAIAPFFSSFSGFQSDQLPIPQVDPPVQPAGFAFSIWGAIYLWLIVSAVFGLIYRRQDAAWNAVRRPLCVSLAAGIPWLWIANESAVWASVTILIMLAFALIALTRSSRTERWFQRGPIALYAGWLTAASFVSLATIGAGYGVLTDGYGWAFVGILGALGVGIKIYSMTPEPVYLLALIWALIGITAANGLENFLVTATALAGSVVLICLMAIYFPRDQRS